jgi:hypothetical protein
MLAPGSSRVIRDESRGFLYSQALFGLTVPVVRQLSSHLERDQIRASKWESISEVVSIARRLAIEYGGRDRKRDARS